MSEPQEQINGSTERSLEDLVGATDMNVTPVRGSLRQLNYRWVDPLLKKRNRDGRIIPAIEMTVFYDPAVQQDLHLRTELAHGLRYMAKALIAEAENYERQEK